MWRATRGYAGRDRRQPRVHNHERQHLGTPSRLGDPAEAPAVKSGMPARLPHERALSILEHLNATDRTYRSSAMPRRPSGEGCSVADAKTAGLHSFAVHSNTRCPNHPGEVLTNEALTGATVTVAGWVRTFRNDRFIALNDGSTIHNLAGADRGHFARVGGPHHRSAAVTATGELSAQPRQWSAVELQVMSWSLGRQRWGDLSHPNQPKSTAWNSCASRHTALPHEHLRCGVCIRHQVSFGKYFHDNGS